MMNNNNNNNNNDSNNHKYQYILSTQPKSPRSQQEHQILWRFRNVFQDVHSTLSKQGNALSPDEDRTLALLYHNPTSTVLTTAVVTLVGLRGGRFLWQRTKGSYSLDRQQRGRGRHWRSYLVDATLGVCLGGVGLFAGALRMDMEEHKGGMGEVPGGLGAIPLQVGRSNIADHFCGPLEQEYRRQWTLATGGGHPKPPFQTLGDYLYNSGWNKALPIDPFDRQDILDRPQNPNLKAYLEFVQNCQKRRTMEQRIRQQRGLNEEDPVEIPPPGLEEEVETRGAWQPVFSSIAVNKTQQG